MIIDFVYTQLRNDGLCDSAYNFSTEYLGRSPSYYSVLKARKAEPSTDVLHMLETVLLKKSEIYKNRNYPFMIRTRNHLVEMHNAVKEHRKRKLLMNFVNHKNKG